MKNSNQSRTNTREAWPEPGLHINSLLASPFDFILILDSDGRILNVSEKNGNRFQLDSEELRGKCIWDLLPPEVIPHRKFFFDTVFRSGAAVRFEDERQGHWNDSIILPIINERGETAKVAVLAYDITNRVEAVKNSKLLARFPEANPSPVFHVNREGHILYANAASGPLLDSWKTQRGKALPKKVLRHVAEALNFGKTKEIEERCGSRTWSLYLTPIADSDFLNIYGFDITERLKATGALRESEERFRNLVETSHDLIWRCDNDGRFTYLNPAWEKTLGYSPDEMLGRHFGEFKPGGITRKDKNLFKRILRGADIFGYETTYMSKSGELVNIVFNVRQLLDADANPQGTQGSAYNITERKKTAEKLQQNEMHYRNLFMNNPAAILETDLVSIGSWLDTLRATGVEDLFSYLQENHEALQVSGKLIRIVAINQSARKMLELRKDDKLLDIIPNIFSKNSFAMLTGLLLAIWEGQTRFDMEGEGFTNKGNPFDFILQWSTPKKDGRADLSRGILALTDVTQTKILKRRLLQNEKMATLGLLVSGISHEINNPNNFIMFNLPILRSYLQKLLPIIDEYSAGQNNFELFGMSYPEFRQDISALLDNMEHGTNRINDTVSRLREFFLPRDREELCWTAIDSVIDRSLALCQSQIRKMVQSVELLLPAGLPKFYTDPFALEHIIVNLLLNAAYAADKQNSWIKLQVLRGKSWQEGLIIEIRDNGCGIDRQSLKKIFEPFYTTKAGDSGSGLGMFICYNMIERLGGRIDVKSKPGLGTTFRVILPEINP